MDYRRDCAETDEQREKEQNFYGIGLTSRKNLCIHPEVSANTTTVALRDHPELSLPRSPKRRRARWWMPAAETSQTPLLVRKAARTPVPSSCAIGTRFVPVFPQGRRFSVDMSAEPRQAGTRQPHPAWNLDPSRRPAVWQRQPDMPLFSRPSNGESPAGRAVNLEIHMRSRCRLWTSSSTPSTTF